MDMAIYTINPFDLQAGFFIYPLEVEQKKVI